MDIEQFASITRNVILDCGLEEFQPTVCFPERKDVKSLAGVPRDEEHEPIALRWAASSAQPEEEYLVAFKCSRIEFKVVRFERGIREHKVYEVEA